MNRRRSRFWRRVSAAAVAMLGLLDVVQAASRGPITKLGWLSLDLGGSTTRLFRYVLLIAALTLVSAARGLLRGKRTAWLLALGAAIASLFGHHLVTADLFGIVVAVGVVGLLLVLAPQFRARSDPALARQGIFWLLGGGAATYGYGVGGLYLLDAQFRRSTSLVESLEQATRLLFLLPTSTINAVTTHGKWFIDSVRVLAIVVLLIGVARLLRPVVLRGARREQDLGHVRRLLDAYGDTSLAYFHLLPDKHHLFAEDGEAFIGYKVVGSIAVSLGGPIGAPAAQEKVARLFIERCELNGWLPAFHQVTPAAADQLARLGLKALKIGEEAVIDVGSFSLQGSHFKSIRNKTAKMEREGWTVEELPQPIDPATMNRLREISEAWLDHGGHRERTFTVGQFNVEYLRSTVLMVAKDPSAVIQAFTNLIPSYQSVNGNFDLMRRQPGEHLPVMDFLFVRMIERFRELGHRGMTLGLAPFANIDGDARPDRALRIIYERGGKAFNFAGLRAFKDKWRPKWEPRFLVYRSDSELPQLAIAVGRAGELPHADTGRLETAGGWTGTVARGTVAFGRRLPFTAALTAVMLALQIQTEVDRDSYDWLHTTFTYNWTDLARHHELQRLLTGIFIQNGAGLRFGVLWMIPLVAISEFILRTWRTIVVFFLGDMVSSVLILVALRLAAALGSAGAARVIADRDGGASSAMFAVITAATLSLKSGRLRRAALSVLTAAIIGGLLLDQRLFDVQHLGAAAVGVACWRAFALRSNRADRLSLNSYPYEGSFTADSHIHEVG